MRLPVLLLKKTFIPIMCAVIIAGAFTNIAAEGDPAITNAVKQGSNISATPISIPRPIRLEKIVNFKLLNSPQSSTLNAGPMPSTQPGSIDICDLKTVKGDQMVLSIQYRLDPSVTEPVYAGGFLYDETQTSVDAGYKPVALRTLPNGTVDFIMALPAKPFKSQYIMTFLIQAGKVIVNQRFGLAFLWEGKMGKMLEPSVAKADDNAKIEAVVKNKAKFCDDYAKEALAQYEFATKHHLPGIVPPVWSNDYNSHYNWCLKVPEDQAIQGSNLRKTHLKKHASTDTPGLPQLSGKQPDAMLAEPLVNTPDTINPMQNKGLDPGRGP